MSEKLIHEYEQGHNPEFVDSGHAVSVLERSGLYEHLSEPSERRQYFAGLADEDFGKFVGYVNARVRGEEPTYQYEDGKLLTDPTPPLVHKDKLMNLTFEAVKGILGDTNLDDSEALLRAGLTIAGGINLTHPYKDGNGRTGRIMDYLIQYGTQRGRQVFEDETRAIIAKTPAYVSEEQQVISDTPHPAILRATKEVAEQKRQKALQDGRKVSPRGFVSLQVATFLEGMSGEGLPLVEDVKEPGGELLRAGQNTVIDLYKAEFHRLSSAPNHNDSHIKEMQRVNLAPKVLTETEKRVAATAVELFSELI